MAILTRYILWEFGKVFLLALSSLTMLILLVGLFQEAREQGLDPAQVLQLVPYILPEALKYTLPATLLFTASICYGRMSGSNEIVALKSLGISPMVVLWPTLALSLVLSLVTVWLNDLSASWGQRGIERVVLENVEEIVYSMLRTQKSYSAQSFSIIVKRVDERTLVQPTITIQRRDSPPLTLRAEEAELHCDLAARRLTISCHNGTVDFGDEVHYRFPDTMEQVIPLDRDEPHEDELKRPGSLSMRQIAVEIDRLGERIVLEEQKLAVRAATEVLLGDWAGLASPEWNNEQELRKARREHLMRLECEPHRRLSNGFCCLCFVMIGAPVAIWRHKAEFWTNFMSCFLPILVLYYPLLALGVDLAKQGVAPPSCVWLGDLIIALLGLVVLRKVLRH